MKKYFTLLCLLTSLSLAHAGPEGLTLAQYLKLGRYAIMRFKKIRQQQRAVRMVLTDPAKREQLLERLKEVKQCNDELLSLCEQHNPKLREKRTTK